MSTNFSPKFAVSKHLASLSRVPYLAHSRFCIQARPRIWRQWRREGGAFALLEWATARAISLSVSDRKQAFWKVGMYTCSLVNQTASRQGILSNTSIEELAAVCRAHPGSNRLIPLTFLIATDAAGTGPWPSLDRMFLIAGHWKRFSTRPRAPIVVDVTFVWFRPLRRSRGNQPR